MRHVVELLNGQLRTGACAAIERAVRTSRAGERVTRLRHLLGEPTILLP